MCGLAGFLRLSDTPDRDTHDSILEAMGEAIRHRGPDAGRVWMDDVVGLVHRRLSIIDLSDAGNQPMVSESGDLVIVFNGEIYNFQSLRKEMMAAGHRFRTQTDTEVLLALYEARGSDCLSVLNGMFALAIWDRAAKRLFLARDRLGKKPLYYYWNGTQLAFASELKALTRAPFVPRQICQDSIKDFFAYQYIPDPKTIYRNIYKLPPGHWLEWSNGELRQHQYWDVSFAGNIGGSVSDLADELRNLIDDAVRLRMVSDVPLGAFLSGGVDSSGVVGLMASTRSGRLLPAQSVLTQSVLMRWTGLARLLIGSIPITMSSRCVKTWRAALSTSPAFLTNPSPTPLSCLPILCPT